MQIIFLGEGCVPYNLLLTIDWLGEHLLVNDLPVVYFN